MAEILICLYSNGMSDKMFGLRVVATFYSWLFYKRSMRNCMANNNLQRESFQFSCFRITDNLCMFALAVVFAISEQISQTNGTRRTHTSTHARALKNIQNAHAHAQRSP